MTEITEGVKSGRPKGSKSFRPNRITEALRNGARAEKLSGGGRASTVSSVQAGAKRVSPREEKEPDTTTYGGRIAKRIRELRKRAGFTVASFHAALDKQGIKVSQSTVYGWENGNVGIDPNHYPAIARALHLTSVRTLLPNE